VTLLVVFDLNDFFISFVGEKKIITQWVRYGVDKATPHHAFNTCKHIFATAPSAFVVETVTDHFAVYGYCFCCSGGPKGGEWGVEIAKFERACSVVYQK
jgi:hypothetical protein